MRIDVELFAPDRAIITRVPSLLARIVLRRSVTERYAVRVLVITGGFRWVYANDFDRGNVDPVEPDVAIAIADAERTARRPRLYQALEPPG